MAELGTPENPEIIDPSLPPPREGLGPRLRLARQMLTILFSVSMPAIFLDLICAWLFSTATTYGGIFTWLAFMLLCFPALIFTLIALVANAVLWPVIVLTLMGKVKNFSMNDPRVQRFVRIQRFGRTPPF